MFQVGLPCYLGLNSGRSVSINVDKTRKHFAEKFMTRACFPNIPSFPFGKHCFQCQVLFSRCKLCLRYTAGNFKENPSMQALAKFLRAWASEHSSNFCEHFRIRWDHSTPLIYTKQSSKNICIEEKVIIRLTFNSGLALAGFRTILPAIQSKTSTWSAVNFKKTWTRWAVNLSPQYGHVILVSGYLVLTGVNWS